MTHFPFPEPAETERIWRVAPSEHLISMLRDIGEDQVLSGPWRASCDVDIDDIFASDFEVALCDLMMDAGLRSVAGLNDQDPGAPLCRYATDLWHNGKTCMDAPEDGARIVACDFGVLLLQLMPDCVHARISGMFWGHTLIIDPASDVSSSGYGRDLVMARLIIDEGMPTWELDTPAYSNAGAATVRSAWRRLCVHEPQNEMEFSL